MKLQLDTNTKTIRIEDNTEIGTFRRAISIILPDDYGNVEGNFVIEVGKVSNASILKLNVPISRSYPYRPDFKWLDYKKGKVKLTDNKIDHDYDIYLKKGSWNIELDI